jgi:hypothetical protein
MGEVQGSLDNPPIVIRSARWKDALLMVFSLAAVLFTIHAAHAGYSRGPIASVLGVALFGLGLPLTMDRLLRPRQMEIAPSGLWLTTKGKRYGWSWMELQDFRVIAVSTTKFVGFDFTDVHRGLGGAEGALPTGWNMAPAPLAKLLNEARAHWWGRSQPRIVE